MLGKAAYIATVWFIMYVIVMFPLVLLGEATVKEFVTYSVYTWGVVFAAILTIEILFED